MKSLCTCAALAVAAAFVQQQLADAMLRSNAVSSRSGTVGTPALTAVKSEENHCVTQINKFRQSLKADAAEYIKYTAADEATALTGVVESLECANLLQGKFEHIDETDGKIFMITAANPKENVGSDMTCDMAVDQWKSGFGAFKNQHPPLFKDYDGQESVYNDPNAVGLFSLLQKGAQTVACGTFAACSTSKFIFCFFKPSTIDAGTKVDPELWHALEAQHKLKPELKKSDTGDEYLKAVNDVRAAVGLPLEAFTNPLKPKSRARRAVEKDTLDTAVQKYLYQLTCEDLSSSKIQAAATDQDYTVIYYIKDIKEDEGAPDLKEAVAHWQTGFAKLNYKIPPVFKMKSMESSPTEQTDAADPEVEASKIYNDSAVAGFVSIMAEGARQMACVEATGCDGTKAGIICFLHKATLVDNAQPISQAVWAKIMKQHGYTLPEFTQLEEGKNCLTEMNAVRTQEKLGLKPLLATVAKSRAATNLSAVMLSVTCEAMDKTSAKSTETTGPQIMITDGTTSLMYHTGTEGTCSEAVEAFKKGYEKFSSAPPAYKSDLAVYQDPAATNFVSLISDGDNTKATCYSTSCTKKSIVCELSPAVLKESEKPVSEATFTKYTEIMKTQETSGAAGFSRAALFGTVVIAIAAGVFFF